jgi:pimeloyl-ACP methyl ester carboxylesterase
MARFVLVHGAFGGAWCWEPAVGPLEAAGHTVTAIDLPGGGDDPTPAEEVTLDGYAARVCEVLAEGEPAVLVGHSMGGVAVKRRLYVLCTQDHSIPPALQRRMVRERGIADVVELDADHAPMLSRTEELVAVLDRFAR